VDDSQVNRDLILSTLAPLGYRVTAAPSVAEALGLLAQVPFDLILSDIHMPGAGGFDLIHAVRGDTRLSGMPFIFITSSLAGDKAKGLTRLLGSARLLIRPIEPEELIHQIEDCLEQRQEA
jgi:CheY-like chemotaxis protein